MVPVHLAVDSLRPITLQVPTYPDRQCKGTTFSLDRRRIAPLYLVYFGTIRASRLDAMAASQTPESETKGPFP